MKTFFLSIAILLACSIMWAGERNDGKLLTEILNKGTVETYGLEKSSQGKALHWTATQKGAGVVFLSGKETWDFSPFVHLVC